MSIKHKKPTSTEPEESRNKSATVMAEMQQFLEKQRIHINNLMDNLHQKILFLEAFEKMCIGENEKAFCKKAIDCIDEWFAEVLARVPSEIRMRTQRSQHKTLLALSAYEAYQGIGDLPDLLERLPESEWDSPDSGDCLGFKLLDELSRLVRFLEKDARKHPDRYRLWAREQPFFPMMVFCNSSAYRWRFSEIVKAVELGQRCPINVSERAQFRFDNPINVFVFEALVEICIWSFSWIKLARAENPEIKWRKGATTEDRLCEQAKIPRALQPIYQRAYDLPPLTKNNAKEWADKVVIPHFETTHPDWKKVKALAPYVGKAGGRAKAKEAIYEAIKALAKPNLP